MKRYALGCAFNLNDLFLNFNLKRLDITCNQCDKIISNRHRNHLCIKIFKEHFKLVINDIIENNITFILPLKGKVQCTMHMKMFEGDDFRRLRRHGKWKDVDFLASMFKGYSIKLFMYGQRATREKFVYVDNNYKNRITEKTNNGMSYGDGKIDKRVKDYLKQMQELFPKVSRNDIIKILNFGWKSLYLHNSYGGDTIITDQKFWCYVGNLKRNPLNHFFYYIGKLTTKIRVLYRKKKIKWDGYYYFALSDIQYENYLKQHNKKGRRRKSFNYGSLFLYQIFDECNITEYYKHYIFRVPFITRLGLKFFNRDFVSDKAELILTRNPLKFKDILINDNKYAFI